MQGSKVDVKKIDIVSPMGSGNTFAHTVLSNSIKVEVECIGHYTKLIKDVGNYIIFFRNPHDCIASAIERHLPSSNDKFILNVDPINITDIKKITELYNFYSSEYTKFLNDQYSNKDNILRITFDFMIKDESNFITTVCNFFNIENYNNSNNEQIKNNASYQIKQYGFENRLPRNKSEDRIKIDNLILKMPDIDLIYRKYLLVKKEIESSLL